MRNADYAFRLTTMSATIAKDEFLHFLTKFGIRGATVYVVAGDTNFPLTQRFFKAGARTEDRTTAVANALFQVHQDYPSTAGLGNGIMAFVPGRQDMTAIEELLAAPEAQAFIQSLGMGKLRVKRALGGRDRVDISSFAPPNSGRQIILATTAAESITIPDVLIVVDTGVMNAIWYNALQRTHELSTTHNSQSQVA
jgi:HrpA-like RNA helicase